MSLLSPVLLSSQPLSWLLGNTPSGPETTPVNRPDEVWLKVKATLNRIAKGNQGFFSVLLVFFRGIYRLLRKNSPYEYESNSDWFITMLPLTHCNLTGWEIPDLFLSLLSLII